MTRRERLERKLELRAEWAQKAASRAAQRFNTAHRITDGIPLGQPILVGHHSEGRHRRDLDRMASNLTKGVEEQELAQHHESKASGLAAQLETAIYSDDPDAIEALDARIAELEAERERMKFVNATIKKGPGWEQRLADAGAPLTEKEKTDLLNIVKFQPFYCKNGQPCFPPYALSNLGGNIGRLKKRREDIQARVDRSANAEANGGVLIEGDTYVRITFAEKPEREILNALKAAGFRWGSGSWCGERAKIPACLSA